MFVSVTAAHLSLMSGGFSVLLALAFTVFLPQGGALSLIEVHRDTVL